METRLKKFSDDTEEAKLLKKGEVARNPKKLKIKPKEDDELIMEKPMRDSSQIREWGYRKSKNRLYVKFKKGSDSVYRYEGVPQEVWDRLRVAESAGSTFHELVKSQNYEFKKLG